MKLNIASCPVFLCFFVPFFLLNGCDNFNCSSKNNSQFQYYKGLTGNPEYTKTYVKNSSANYDFGTVIQFKKLYHQFIIQNNDLDIFRIRMARSTRGQILITSFDKEIKYGEEGKISLIINTYSRGGDEIEDHIVVETEDKKRPHINLYISGKVTKFATVSPPRIQLKNSGNNYMEGSTVIMPEKKYPFKIRDIKARDGRYISYDFREIEKDKNIAYIIKVKSKTNTRKYIRDILFIETDSDVQPEIPIRVRGRIKVN